MLILGIDTSAKAAGAGVVKDGALLSDLCALTALTHSETLLTLTDRALKTAGVGFEELDAVAVSAGPGSFTGIRIGVSAVKGMCFDSGKPVYGVSTLEALAVGAALPGFVICPVMDARCAQVYNALFESENGALKRLSPDRAIRAADLAEELAGAGRPALLIGDGAAVAAAALDERGAPNALMPEIFRCQHGSAVAFAAWMRYNKGEQGICPDLLAPSYLRPSQAERERAKRLGLEAQ